MKIYKLKDITQIYTGATPLTRNEKFYKNGKIPWITPKDLSGYKHKYIFHGKRNITKAGFNSCSTKLLPKGTVLFSSRAPIGYVAIAGNKLCTNQGFKSFICNPRFILNDYLYYYLINKKKEIAALGNGSTFKEISKNGISNYNIVIPNLSIQRKIVNKLNILDYKYEINSQMMQTIYELIFSLYNKSFVQNENFLSYKKLDKITDIVTGGTPSKKNPSYWKNGIYNWYTPTDITSTTNIFRTNSRAKINTLGLLNSSTKLVPAGSVLMTSRATVGEAIIVKKESCTNQGILSLIPKKDLISSIHLYCWIIENKNLIKSIGNGSTFKEVYKRNLLTLKIGTNNSIENKFNLQVKPLLQLYSSLITENNLLNNLKHKYYIKYFKI